MINLKVPKKYEKYFGRLELNPDYDPDIEEFDKYILYYADGYAYMGEYPIWNVKSKKEAIECLKEAETEKDYENLKKKGVV